MKKVKYLLSSLILTLMVPLIVNAASASIGVRSASSIVTVGSSVNVTVTLSSATPIGAWDFNIAYDSSCLQMTSGSAHVVDYTQNASGIKSKSYNYSFKALKSCNTSVGISGAAVYAMDETQMQISAGKAAITSKTAAEIQASYSKVNDLASLSVAGYEISPSFNESTLEYTLEVENDTTKVTIQATKKDNRSSINGVGEVELEEGPNTFNITCTAQNGTPKTYKLVITRKELDPINVTVDGDDYKVVRKREELQPIAYYEETTVTIDDKEVPAYKSETTKYTLVGLKDEEGNVSYYIYEDGKYTKYIELKTKELTFIQQEPSELIKDYEKSTEIEFNDIKLNAYYYKDNKDTKYFIIYGMNLETGKTDWYQINIEENTIQLFNKDFINEISKQNKQYLLYLMIASGVAVLLFIFLIIQLISKKRLRKKATKLINVIEKHPELLHKDKKVEEKPKVQEPQEEEHKDEKTEVIEIKKNTRKKKK